MNFTFISHPNLRVQEGGASLQVLNAQLLDIGSYTCIASNVAGNATKEFVLNVLGKYWLLALWYRALKHLRLLVN